MSDKPEPRWDLDYKIGRQAEMWVESIRDALASGSVEVKNHRRFHETGNIYVEYECKGKPSGLAKTESQLWVHVLVEGELALIISTEKLKEMARLYFRSHHAEETDGSHPTQGVKIPVIEIIRAAISPKMPKRI